MVAGVESDLYASHFLLAFDIVVDIVLIVCYHKSIFYVDGGTLTFSFIDDDKSSSAPAQRSSSPEIGRGAFRRRMVFLYQIWSSLEKNGDTWLESLKYFQWREY